MHLMIHGAQGELGGQLGLVLELGAGGVGIICMYIYISVLYIYIYRYTLYGIFLNSPSFSGGKFLEMKQIFPQKLPWEPFLGGSYRH